MAEALYRKYRPQIFEDVVGQEPIERTLKNAIAQDKVSHAYLLCGPRGTGKTTTARLIAKALLCENGPTPNPDGTCEDCRLIADGAHPDVYELDAASRTGVENVREEIINRVQFAPTRGKYKVYIVDEVHMLSTAAFNALLKTLEEPPSHVVFILCTTDPQKVPETIHSRCQRFDFRRISPESIVSRLGAICVSEDVEFEGEALDLIAHRAEGGMRNALTTLEQIIAFENGKVTLAGAERILGSVDSNDMAEIIAAIGKRDVAACFRWIAEYVESGADLAQFTRDMADHVRNMYIMAVAGDDIELDISETMRSELQQERQWFGEGRLSRMLCLLGDLLNELKSSTNRRLSFEIALTRMVRPDSDLTIASLAERVEALEAGYSAVAMTAPAGAVENSAASGQAPVAVQQPAASHQPSQPQVAMQPQAAAVQAGAQAGVLEQPLSDAQIKLQELQRERIYEKEEQRQREWRGNAPAQPQVNAQAPAQQAPQGEASRPQAAEMNQRPQQPAPATQQHAKPIMNAPVPAPAASQVGSSVGALTAASNPAAPTAVVAGGSISANLAQNLQNPAALSRIWQATMAAVKKHKTAYGVLFMNTRVHFDSARGCIAVEFQKGNEFAFNTVQRPEVREVLASCLTQAAGEAVPFEIIQSGGAGVAGRPAASAQPAQATAPARPAAFTAPASQPAPVQPAPAPGQVPSSSAPIGGASRPATPRQNAPCAAPSYEQAPDPDPVPYDDVVPYGDDAAFDTGSAGDFDMPTKQPFASQQSAATQTGGSFANPAPAAQMPASQPAPQPESAQAAPAQPVSAGQSAATQASAQGDMEASELEAMFQEGFGGGVVFKEVQ
jgi:DNA polymerase III subunit gamma/tau